MKKENKRFRHAFNGYNKKDVNAYLADLNTRYQTSQNEMNAAMTALREKLAEAEKKAACVDEIAVLNRKLAEAEQKLSDYEKLSADYGRRLLEAQAQAEQIVASAKAEAEEQQKAWEEELRIAREKEKERADRLQASYEDTASSVSETLLAMTKEKISTLADNLRSAADRIIRRTGDQTPDSPKNPETGSDLK